MAKKYDKKKKELAQKVFGGMKNLERRREMMGQKSTTERIKNAPEI